MEGQRLVNLSLTNAAERSRAILLERNNNDSDAVDYVDEYNEQEGKETINQLYVLYYKKLNKQHFNNSEISFLNDIKDKSQSIKEKVFGLASKLMLKSNLGTQDDMMLKLEHLNIIDLVDAEEPSSDYLLATETRCISFTFFCDDLVKKKTISSPPSPVMIRKILMCYNGFDEKNIQLDAAIHNDFDIIHNLSFHFLRMIESTKNPITQALLERTAATYISIPVVDAEGLIPRDTPQVMFSPKSKKEKVE